MRSIRRIPLLREPEQPILAWESSTFMNVGVESDQLFIYVEVDAGDKSPKRFIIQLSGSDAHGRDVKGEYVGTIRNDCINGTMHCYVRIADVRDKAN